MSCTWQFSLSKASRDIPQEWKFTNFIFASAVKLPLKVFQNSFRTNNPNCPFSLRSSDFDDENLKTFFKAQKVFARLSSILVDSRHRLWDTFLFMSNSSVVVLSKNVSTSPICGRRAQHKKTGSIVELNYSIYGEQFVEFFLSLFAAASFHSLHAHSVTKKYWIITNLVSFLITDELKYPDTKEMESSGAAPRVVLLC